MGNMKDKEGAAIEIALFCINQVYLIFMYKCAFTCTYVFVPCAVPVEAK